MSNEISKKITEEMLDYSVRVIRFVEAKSLPRSIVEQVTRSVTSVGANYTEAQDAASRKDFANKIYIAKKEASETLYWLKFVEKYSGTSEELAMLQEISQKYVMTLQKIVNSLRSK